MFTSSRKKIPSTALYVFTLLHFTACGKAEPGVTSKAKNSVQEAPSSDKQSPVFMSEADVFAKLDEIRATHENLDQYEITIIGHGAYSNRFGNVEPELAHILVSQEMDLEDLRQYALTHKLELPDDRKPAHQDAVIARGHRIIDWIDTLELSGYGTTRIVHVNLLKLYQAQILGLDASALVTLSQKLLTSNSGQAYVNECNMNGVPTPDVVRFNKNAPVYNPANGKPPLMTWINWGIFSGEFEVDGLDAQLWSMEFSEGVCLALPRWSPNTTSQTDVASLAGVVCLGYQTGKACYFDYVNLQSNEQRGIQAAVSGAALANHNGGECSNCHAGNNPFVVHPEKTPFANLIASQVSLRSSKWPDPIVPNAWVQNPGPLRSLGPVPNGEGSCTTCHNAASALQFPSVSTALSTYCDAIFKDSVGLNAPSPTMPPSYMPQISYATHIERLQKLCEFAPTTTTTTTNIPEDDEDVVSPPLITPPLYECATAVHVYGARIGSTVTLSINGQNVASQVVTDPDNIEFTLGSGLQDGDEVEAVQTNQQGNSSDPSTPVYVYSHTIDYPNGLPAPRIDPTIVHECGYKIAVRHENGTLLHVRIGNGSFMQTYGSAQGYSVANAQRTFIPNDQVRVVQSLCGDESSPSAPATALPAPSPLSTPTLDPPQIFNGQQKFVLQTLTQSGDVIIEENNLGQLLNYLSWPTSGYSESTQTLMQRPVQSGDSFVFSQQLCSNPGPSLVTNSVQSCQELPPLRIQQPFEGDTFVIIESMVPGGTIRVWSADEGAEIGDGGGHVIALIRPVEFGETLVIVQQLTEECVDSTAYEVIVK